MSTGSPSLAISLALAPETDNILATVSVVLPDTCYKAGELKQGNPTGEGILPLHYYLTLEVTHTEGEMCGEMITTVTPTINLPYVIGFSGCTAFVTVNGVVAGSASKPLPQKP